jgi:simple sugar transport system substrate-binding protein
MNRRTVLAALMAAVVALSGCDRNEQARPAVVAVAGAIKPAATVDGAAAGSRASSTVTTAASDVIAAAGAAVADAATAAAGFGRAEAAAADSTVDAVLNVAFAYAGSVAEGSLAMAHERGRREMEAALGGKVRSTVVQGLLPDSDVESVLRQLATQGNRLIFTTTPGHVDVVRRLAGEFPTVRWEHAAGIEKARNLRGYGTRTYQGAYLAGVVAGRMTRTDLVGFVASVPVPEVIRNIDAFALGAQSVNPAARTKVAWVNRWFDPGREAEAAQALISAGADVLLQNTGSAAPLQVAEKAGKHAFGWGSDMREHGRKAHLGSVVVNWGPYYTRSVRQLLEGEWKADSSWVGIKEGAVDLVSLSDAIPADLKALVAERKKAIADGSLRIWKGPMLTSENREILPTGSIADDRFIADIMFYVKGVEGRIPGGS